MSILVAKVGRSGAGGANADYITRLNGAEKIAFFNLDHLESEEIHEARTNAIAYAHAREEIELAKGKKIRPKDKESSDEKLQQNTETVQPTEAGESQAGGEESTESAKTKNVKEKNKHTKEKQIRTHYRLIASWEGKETSEKAIEEIKIYLQQQFPKAKAIIAIHQDTEDTHAHVWIDARQTDGKKIHLKEDKFESLDEKWTEQYDRTYGTNFAPAYKALKVETKEWKKEIYEWRKAKRENVEGAELKPEPIKPQRAADRFTNEYWREKEIKELTQVKTTGIRKNENINSGTNHSDAQRPSRSADGRIESNEREQFISQGTEQADARSNQGVKRTEQDLSRAIEYIREYNQSDISNHQPAQSNGAGFPENQTQYSPGDAASYVYSQGNGSAATEPPEPQISQKQFYEDRFGFGQTNGIDFSNSNPGDYQRNSTIGKFNIDLNQMPEIQYQVPQLQMDAQAMIQNTVELVTDSLDRQGRKMEDLALCLYKEHLNGIATTPPSQIMIQKINQLNQGLPADDRVETKNKSWLEVNHDYLLSLATQSLDKEAMSIANEFEDDLVDKRKQNPEYRELNEDNSWSLKL
jgi:hypothetical protein